jgi:hypothetical protein
LTTPFTEGGEGGIEGVAFTGGGVTEGVAVAIGVSAGMVRHEVRKRIRALRVAPPFLIIATSISRAALVSNDPIQSAAFPNDNDDGDYLLKLHYGG